MPFGRIPGPYGYGEIYGCVFVPLARGRSPQFLDVEQVAYNTPGPAGTNGDPSEVVANAGKTVSEEDEKELALLKAVYGVLRKNGGDYKYKDKKGKWHDDVETYVKDRNEFFGSAEAYTEYKENALEELEADNGKLRNVIEPPLATRKVKAEWKDAQTVFYCWVRRAYQKQLGDKADIPKIIKAGMSDKLKEALAQVKSDYGAKFQAGGFNPRPMKLNGRYRLGTLSEHAVGNAIDIEDKNNAQIKGATWGHILKFTGKSLDHATRQSKWKSAPAELHTAVKEINDEFVKRLDDAIKEAEAASKSAAANAAVKPVDGKAAAPKTDPLQSAIEQDEDLKKIGKAFLQTWKGGFFSLEWSLLKELHEEGFTWGATFSDPDLHHFEL